jgi:hypothetical protein
VHIGVFFIFVQCRPEYKVSGLYVIDSIVRQSRHQFGADKDVFAQRFSKNIVETFRHLYTGAPEEKVFLFIQTHLHIFKYVFFFFFLNTVFDMLSNFIFALHNEIIVQGKSADGIFKPVVELGISLTEKPKTIFLSF